MDIGKSSLGLSMSEQCELIRRTDNYSKER